MLHIVYDQRPLPQLFCFSTLNQMSQLKQCFLSHDLLHHKTPNHQYQNLIKKQDVAHSRRRYTRCPQTTCDPEEMNV